MGARYKKPDHTHMHITLQTCCLVWNKTQDTCAYITALDDAHLAHTRPGKESYREVRQRNLLHPISGAIVKVLL